MRRAHGLSGEVLVYVDTDDAPDVFRLERRFGVRAKRSGEDRPSPCEVTLLESRPHRGGLLLRFAEVTGRDAAEALVGAELVVERDELRPLEEGEYFLHELVGLEVVDERAGELGPVAEVYETAARPLAAVRIDGKERLFPLHGEVVRKVDLEERRIEVTLPPGLLDL